MIKSLIHRIVAIPLIYDLIQTLVGAKQVRQRLQRQLTGLNQNAVVMDIGGGTGLNRALFPDHIRYICLDNDPVKLSGLMQKEVDGHALLGDAGKMPIPTGSVDMVICTSVTHHLLDDVLVQFFQEAMRVLKPDGRFVVLDAVWLPNRIPSRILWKYDRGSFPRPAQTLHDTLSQYGKELHWEEFTILHRYIIGIFKKHEVVS
ncbi:MAG: class I SAM-dependent methyltransferase [Anaerolineae bacterium]|nr:class I SAM-dependent methyltransferase [Anaerolineae bacterium]